MADLLRRQMRAVGLLHALAPVMDVARDARWGRVMEPGPVELSAGSSSSDIRSSAGFTVTGKARTIRGEDRAFLSVADVGAPGAR
jgi:hypothetical protein